MDILVAFIWLQLALHNVVNEISKLYISLISCEQTARIFPRSQASISKPLPPHTHMNTSKETHLSPQNLIGWCDDVRCLMFPYVMSHRLIILRTPILHFCLFCCMRPFDWCQFIDFRIKEKKEEISKFEFYSLVTCKQNTYPLSYECAKTNMCFSLACYGLTTYSKGETNPNIDLPCVLPCKRKPPQQV